MRSIILFVAIAIMVTLGVTGIANVYGQEKVQNYYFSINIPDNWAYIETSNTPESKNTGFGPVNSIALTPNEFSEILLIRDNAKLIEKIEDGSIYANFLQDTEYPKNAALESYAKYQINNYGISNITSQQYTTVGNEKSVRLYANGTYPSPNTKTALYLVMHDKVPYTISYSANVKNYEKYLPDFEQMVKSFRFADVPSEIENLSDNDNLTSTRGQIDYDSKQWEEWVEEQINNVFETEFNITGIESEQEMRIKMAIGICNNPEHYSTLIGIEPEVFTYRCDFVMKELRDRGLIK